MKNLYLRLDRKLYTKEQIEAIIQFFKQFFKTVLILDISEQRKALEQLVNANSTSVVVSLDKFLPLDHNLDVSRVHDIEGNYLHHVLKYDGRKYKDQNIILYDHDVIHGIGFNLAKASLEFQGCTVTSFSFISLTKEQTENVEILDLADFLSVGLVVQIDNPYRKNNYFLTRHLYQHNKEILHKKASINYEDYKKFYNGINDLIHTYQL